MQLSKALVLNSLALLIIAGVAFTGCTAQERKGVTTLIDPIEITPFDLKIKSDSVTIPDSVSSDKVNGTMHLKLFINTGGQLEGFNIIRFSRVAEGDTLVSTFAYNTATKNIGSYPREIQLYYPLLSDFVKNITIIKRPGTPQDVYQPVILVHLTGGKKPKSVWNKV